MKQPHRTRDYKQRTEEQRGLTTQSQPFASRADAQAAAAEMQQQGYSCTEVYSDGVNYYFTYWMVTK